MEFLLDNIPSSELTYTPTDKEREVVIIGRL